METLLFAPTSTPSLPSHAPWTLHRYPNGEIEVRLETHVEGKRCYIESPANPQNSTLFELLALSDTLKKEGAISCVALIPFLHYSRHDHPVKDRSLLTKLMGKVLQSSGIDEVITIDLHSKDDQTLFPIPIRSIDPAPHFAQAIIDHNLTVDQIVSPDEGGKKRCQRLAKALDKELITLSKKRENGVIHTEVPSTLKKSLLIYDDILDTGGTLLSSLEKLTAGGATEFVLCITHPQLSGDRWKEIWNYPIKALICTNSLPLPEPRDERFIQIDIPLLD
ncbi:MAG: Ribose-phosphate pyrophosphokinase [Chlamydiia bacterium]|nr:Ribose-phosphate pyrophosphokinase [Chlamydiia bacterium]